MTHKNSEEKGHVCGCAGKFEESAEQFIDRVVTEAGLLKAGAFRDYVYHKIDERLDEVDRTSCYGRALLEFGQSMKEKYGDTVFYGNDPDVKVTKQKPDKKVKPCREERSSGNPADDSWTLTNERRAYKARYGSLVVDDKGIPRSNH